LFILFRRKVVYLLSLLFGDFGFGGFFNRGSAFVNIVYNGSTAACHARLFVFNNNFSGRTAPAKAVALLLS